MHQAQEAFCLLHSNSLIRFAASSLARFISWKSFLFALMVTLALVSPPWLAPCQHCLNSRQSQSETQQNKPLCSFLVPIILFPLFAFYRQLAAVAAILKAWTKESTLTFISSCSLRSFFELGSTMVRTSFSSKRRKRNSVILPSHAVRNHKWCVTI